MKGYRTLIFSAFMAAIGMLGIKVSPAVALHWGDMFIAAWGMGAILLRQITSTPVGVAAVQAVIKDVATPSDIADVRGGIATLLEHVQILEPVGKMLLAMAQKLDAALAVISAAPAPAAAAPEPDPAPAPVVDQQPVPIAEIAATLVPPAAVVIPAPAPVPAAVPTAVPVSAAVIPAIAAAPLPDPAP